MISIIKNKNTYLIIGTLFVILLWFLISSYVGNSYIVPTVNETIDSLVKLLKTESTYKILGFTLLRLFIALSVCFVSASLLASLSIASSKFRYFIKPLITLLKTLPIAVVIILLLIAFGREYSSYYIVSVVLLPLLYEAILAGMDNIDKSIIDEIRMVSNTNLMIISKIYFPLSFPFILTGLVQSIGLGLKVLVMAEYISQPKYSIGNELVFYKDIAVDMSYVYAWSIIIVLFILVVDSLLALTKKQK